MIPAINGQPAPHVTRPLYYNADGTSNGGTHVVDGTFDRRLCCGRGYQLMTPRRPTERDYQKGLVASPCGVKDCPDGKIRRQGYYKAGWKKITRSEALRLDDETAIFVSHKYAEHPETPVLVVRIPTTIPVLHQP